MKLGEDELFKVIKEINEVFYEKIFEDSWLGEVFRGVNQDFIKAQQTDFIVGALGGPKRYSGRSPKDAHPHIFIQEDMWQLREKYLKEAFQQLNTPEWIVEKWLKIDESFKASILKKSVSQLTPRYAQDDFIIVYDKNKKAA